MPLNSRLSLLSFSAMLLISVPVFANEGTASGLAEPNTIFQSADPPSSPVDFRADAAVVYGVDDRFTSRVQAWSRLGYRTDMMTGAAWGSYNHYIDGRYDGKNHADEGQVDPQGNVIWHHPGVPYMVPSDSYVEFLKSLCRQAIDAGVEAIHLEEPEFWSRAGYSEGFKREWLKEYGEEWQRPDSSPDAFWRSSKLKYLLYKRTLERLFADAKNYAVSKGRTVRCYVPTHSLVSYSQWGIVSPESSLMDLDNCDGYIAQVWTGTARTPNHYRGVQAERTFETAFLEYSSMYYMVAPTGRTVYFLADPVEDDPKHTWDDYRTNYRKTVAASLLFPEVHHFEVMPWPDRVFTYKYPSGLPSGEKTTIPPDYAAELLTVVNALNDMKQPQVKWESGNREVGVLVSDTMMFQRGNNWGENGPIQFNAFYGMALPLVKAGVPVKCLVLERCLEPGALEQVETLFMSYEAMKPLKPEYNNRLSEWVKAGGHLVYIGDDSDPFHTAREWWNQDGKTSSTAREHLFATLETPKNSRNTTSSWSVGRGQVTWYPQHPAKLAMDGNGPEIVADLATGNGTRSDLSLEASPYIRLRRGPYMVGAVLHESAIEQPMELKGDWLDLFSSKTLAVTNPVVKPGNVFLFRSLNEPYSAGLPDIIASTARADETTVTAGSVEFLLKSSSSIPVHQVILRARVKPARVEVNNDIAKDLEWSEQTQVLRVQLPWQDNGMKLKITQ